MLIKPYQVRQQNKMAVYIRLNNSEIQSSRKNILALQDSFSNLERSKSKFKILEKEKQERVNEVRNNLSAVDELMIRVEKELPKMENPYIKTELTAKGIEVSPILQLKTQKDYLNELREINKQLKIKK